MPSESCPICGEETDADMIDGHGHFDLDDDEEYEHDIEALIADDLAGFPDQT